jgi:hypothetical protein
MRTLRILTTMAMMLALPAFLRAQERERGGGRGERFQERPSSRQSSPRPSRPEGRMERRPEGRMERGGRPAARRIQEVEREAPPMRRQERGQERDRQDRGRDRSPERGFEEPRRDRGDSGRGQGSYPVRVRERGEARDWQGARGWERHGAWQPHRTWEEHRVADWGAVHRTWAQRGGYGGYWIPQDRFYAYYGPSHVFRFYPQIYLGYPRFSYGPYWFLIVDPWPGEWDDAWYDSGDCYIDYVGDGYYLFNRAHPGVAIAVTVML